MRVITWILLANTAQSRLLEDDGQNIREVHGLSNSNASEELHLWRPAPQSGSLTAEGFASQIGAFLEKAQGLNMFHHLVILADLPFLKMIDDAITPKVRNLLLTTSARDSFGLSPGTLRTRLEAKLKA